MVSITSNKPELSREETRNIASPNEKELIKLIWEMVDQYIPEAHASEFYQRLKIINDKYGDNAIRHRHGYRFRHKARLT